MKRRFLFLCILIYLLVNGSGSAEVAASSLVPDEGSFAGFAQELEQIRQALKIPGLSAAIVQDQSLVWAQGFGYADMENSIPATADTPYHFASVTKPIAATLLMQLEEAGQLTLDAPVSQSGVGLMKTRPFTPQTKCHVVIRGKVYCAPEVRLRVWMAAQYAFYK